MICAIALLALAGCKHHKGPQGPEVTATDSELPGEPLTQVFQLLENTYQEWEDVQMPVTLSLVTPNKMSISGKATMVRDSAIYLSLRMLGMEVAQAYANPDSVWFVDKYHKMYVQESLQSLCGSYPMALDDIQDCLLGQAFPIDAHGVTAEYNLEAEVPWLTGMYFYRQDPPRVVALTYNLVQETPAGLACNLMNLSAATDSLSMTATVQWTLDKAQWNQGRTVTFKRPNAQFKRAYLQALMKNQL